MVSIDMLTNSADLQMRCFRMQSLDGYFVSGLIYKRRWCHSILFCFRNCILKLVVLQYPILFQDFYIKAGGVSISYFVSGLIYLRRWCHSILFCFKNCILTPMVSQYPFLFQDFYINFCGVTVSYFVSGLVY